MPKAEAGTPKAIANKMKSKGLQRLRWYCQVCEKQTRDENGFKQHCMSEGHVRNMQIVGANSQSFINDYSNQFRRDFIQLLRTSHGEKWVQANHFYQEYISNKEHVHMNSTKWPSLTEFVKFLGREGICRVKEEEKGLFVAWVDDSPEALRRNEAVKKKERQDRGDEHREQKLLQQQIERAREQQREIDAAKEARRKEIEEAKGDQETEPKPAEPIKFGFGAKKPEPAKEGEGSATAEREAASGTNTPVEAEAKPTAPAAPIKIGFGAPKAKNIFAEEKKKNPFKTKKIAVEEPPKKMSEAERIMKEEMERKRKFTSNGNGEEKKRMRL